MRVLKHAFSLKVAIHEADAGYVSGQVPFPRSKGLTGLLPRFLVTLRPSTFPADIMLRDGDRIGGLTGIHLPGHTPGSPGFPDPASTTFFSGDTIRSDGKILF